MSEQNNLVQGLNESAQIIYQNNKDKGFWDQERNVGELLMLVTSELGEAMEAHRKAKFANRKGLEYLLQTSYAYTSEGLFEGFIKDTFEDEIADAIIRLLDLSAGLDIDIEFHIRAKVEYNKQRERLHGKNY